MTEARSRKFCAVALAAVVAFSCVGMAVSAAADPPARVVSTNLCTDLLALLIAAPGQLHSVSYVAQDPRSSIMADEAKDYPANHGLAEEVFVMKPDLVLAGAFTRRATSTMLRRLGFRVETFHPARSLADIRANIRRLGGLLGREQRASELIEEVDSDLARSSRLGATGKRAALYYANNYTSGIGTLASQIVRHAGLENLGHELGLQGMVKLPLELLVIGKPDLLITESRQRTGEALAYDVFMHPALKALAGQTRGHHLTDRTWTCGTPFTVKAIERLAAAARAIKEAPRP